MPLGVTDRVDKEEGHEESEYEGPITQPWPVHDTDRQACCYCFRFCCYATRLSDQDIIKQTKPRLQSKESRPKNKKPNSNNKHIQYRHRHTHTQTPLVSVSSPPWAVCPPCSQTLGPLLILVDEAGLPLAPACPPRRAQATGSGGCWPKLKIFRLQPTSEPRPARPAAKSGPRQPILSRRRLVPNNH